LNIIPTVGRTGRITYVAKLKPVNLSGSIVSSATLHNAEFITTNDIRVGDYVEIFKAGEIIPKVFRPILSKRNDILKQFVPITNCPICNSKLEKQDNEVDQYCTNVSCDARIIQSLIHFCSKDAMNIEGLSDKNIEKLYKNKILNNIESIYIFHKNKEQILKLDLKIKDKTFSNIVQNIENSKSNSLEKLIFALGIRHVGEITARNLAKHFLSIDKLFQTTIEELLKIADIGETVSISIFNFITNQANRDLIKNLQSFGINTKYLSSNIDISNQYYKKTFVITGSFDIPRNEIKNKLKQKYDAMITNTIGNSVDYLIVGDKAGSKLEKAKELNIKLIYDKI
jgi:DNA ligase (NAD+)